MNGEQPWKRSDWMITILLFVFTSSVYFATTSGITSSNDGSHYALVRTMVENRTFALQGFDDYAEGNDIAITEDGRLFSDRPPGTALLGALFYAGGAWLPGTPAQLPSRHDAGNPRLLLVMMLPALVGAGSVILLYTFMRMLSLSRAPALTAVLVFALGTLHWKYSSVLFSHALSSFVVLLSLFLTVRLARRTRTGWPGALLLGLVLGYAVLVEYSNALLVLIVLGYLFWQRRLDSLKDLLTLFGPLLLGGLLSALFLGFYNNVNFGSPLRLSYAYAANYPWASSFATTFNFPIIQGLQGLLVGGAGDGWCDGTCYNQGVLLLSPVLLLALGGWPLYYEKARKECILTTGVFLVYLLLFAKHRTFHGFTADGRYLVPFLSLAVIPLGFAFAWLLTLRRHPVWQAVLLLVTYGLFFLSLRNVFLHIGFSYNYNLDLAQLSPMIAGMSSWRYLAGQVLVNVANLPYLWLLEAMLLALLLALWRLRRIIQKWNKTYKKTPA